MYNKIIKIVFSYLHSIEEIILILYGVMKMAHIMTKRGSQDNVLTYEHFCDTQTDLANIDPQYITLGSVAVVIDGMEMYIANSNKQWISMTPTNEEENGGEG